LLAFAVLDLMASLECERKKGRWRNHRTPGKSSNQERQEQEKGRGLRERKGGGGTTALQGNHQIKIGKNSKKRKKGGGGTTALQGSHQTKKGKKGKKSTKRRKCGRATTRCVRLSPKATVHFLFHGHWG
jgi:hypothetical protein